MEDKDPQLWHLSNSKRLREASSSIRKYLESRYLKHLNVERTGKMYGTIVDRSDDDEDGTESRGNYQRIGECRDKKPQQLFQPLQCVEDEACVIGRPDGARGGPTIECRQQPIAILRRCT